MNLKRKMRQPVEAEGMVIGCAGAFGLSRIEYAELVRVMLAVTRKMGIGAHAEPMDVVHEALLLALVKHRSEWPPIEDKKRFFGWMCALARFAAFNICKPKGKRIFLAVASHDVLAGVPDERLIQSVMEEMQVRETVLDAYDALPPAQREIVGEHVLAGRSIEDLAVERKCHRATLHRHFAQAMANMRTAVARAVQALVVVCVLLRANASMASTRVKMAMERLPLRVVIGFGASAAVLTGSAALGPDFPDLTPQPPLQLRGYAARGEGEPERASFLAPPSPRSIAKQCGVGEGGRGGEVGAVKGEVGAGGARSVGPVKSVSRTSARMQSTSPTEYATASPLSWIRPTEVHRKPSTRREAVQRVSPAK